MVTGNQVWRGTYVEEGYLHFPWMEHRRKKKKRQETDPREKKNKVWKKWIESARHTELGTQMTTFHILSYTVRQGLTLAAGRQEQLSCSESGKVSECPDPWLPTEGSRGLAYPRHQSRSMGSSGTLRELGLRVFSTAGSSSPSKLGLCSVQG